MNSIWSILFLVLATQEAVLTAHLPARAKSGCKHEETEGGKSSGRSFPLVPYVVEITRNFLRFQTFGCEPLEVKLTETESEEIRKLSFEFVKLLDSSKISAQDEAEVLDWKDLNPIIVLTNTEISIRFVKMAPGSESDEETGKRFIYWKFLTEYAKNVFENKLKELNVTVENGGSEYGFNIDESTDDAANFQNFLDTLWKIMKISVNYAEDNAKGWTKLTPDVTSPKTRETSESVTLTTAEGRSTSSSSPATSSSPTSDSNLTSI